MDLGATALHARTARLHGLSDERGLRRRAGRASSGAAGGQGNAAPARSREAVLLIAETGREPSLAVLLERRPAPGIWGGLWSPPQFEDESAALEWCRREIGEPESSAILGADRSCIHAFRSALEAALRVRCKTLGRARGVREADDRFWYALERAAARRLAAADRQALRPHARSAVGA